VPIPWLSCWAHVHTPGLIGDACLWPSVVARLSGAGRPTEGRRSFIRGAAVLGARRRPAVRPACAVCRSNLSSCRLTAAPALVTSRRHCILISARSPMCRMHTCLSDALGKVQYRELPAKNSGARV
jgi:hypothetical protein